MAERRAALPAARHKIGRRYYARQASSHEIPEYHRRLPASLRVAQMVAAASLILAYMEPVHRLGSPDNPFDYVLIM